MPSSQYAFFMNDYHPSVQGIAEKILRQIKHMTMKVGQVTQLNDSAANKEARDLMNNLLLRLEKVISNPPSLTVVEPTDDSHHLKMG